MSLWGLGLTRLRGLNNVAGQMSFPRCKSQAARHFIECLASQKHGESGPIYKEGVDPLRPSMLEGLSTVRVIAAGFLDKDNRVTVPREYGINQAWGHARPIQASSRMEVVRS